MLSWGIIFWVILSKIIANITIPVPPTTAPPISNLPRATYTVNPTTAVTNEDYEIRKNESKRTIKLLKPQYLSTFIKDMRNIVKYETSSQYINRTTKAAYNPNATGV